MANAVRARGRRRLCARPTALSATATPTKASALAPCARVRAWVGACVPLERAHQVAACKILHATNKQTRFGQTTCNMLQTIGIQRHALPKPRVRQATRNVCRLVRQRAAAGAVMQQATCHVHTTPRTVSRFGVRQHARGCAVCRLFSAAQRSVTRRDSGRPRRRRAFR
jgi:hypothetical protein